MAEYITIDDVQNRLTPSGLAFVADRDLSGTGVTSDEIELYITPAIKYAGALVDQAIAAFSTPDNARNQGNQWLKDRCLDIAAMLAIENGGENVPQSMKDRYEFSIAQLEMVRDESILIPGFTYPAPEGGRDSTAPRVRNIN